MTRRLTVRRIIEVAFVAVWAVCVVAAGWCSAAPDEERAVRQSVAQLLGLTAGAVDVIGDTTVPEGASPAWSAKAAGQSLWVRLNRDEGKMLVRWLSSNNQREAPESGREVASLFIGRRFRGAQPRVTFAQEGPIGNRSVYYLWRREVAPGVVSGDTAVVIVRKGNGQPGLYSEQRAVRPVNISDVKLSKDQAIGSALRSLLARHPDWRDPVLRNLLLVLSSPLAPNNGPVWQVTFGKNDGVRGETVTAVLDALSGREISPRDALQ